MRIAVVTPYLLEDTAVLSRCHESVVAQTHLCTHIMVADGFPNSAVDTWGAHHITLPHSHSDIGDTARLIGAFHAIGLEFDAVAFLDADNWYRPDHIANLVDLQERARAAFVCSSRELMSLDGISMGPCPLTDPESFIDTSCMMFTRDSYHLLHHWCLIPPYAHLIGDRVMLQRLRRSGVKRAYSPARSVYYSCGKEGLYTQLGRSAPAGVQPRPDYESAMARWEADGNPSLRGRRSAQFVRRLAALVMSSVKLRSSR
ncbi:MAG: glycosyltransferase [Planctomycetaceae bacterium]